MEMTKHSWTGCKGLSISNTASTHTSRIESLSKTKFIHTSNTVSLLQLEKQIYRARNSRNSLNVCVWAELGRYVVPFLYTGN